MPFSSDVANPTGFRPKRYLNGTPWNGAIEWFYCPSTDTLAIGMYDPVESTGTATAVGDRQVKQAVAAGAILGFAVAFSGKMPDRETSLAPPSTDSYDYRPAATNMYVGVVTDRNVVFEAQADADIAAASIGLNCDIIAASAPNTTTGLSTAAIDASEVGATGTMKVLGITRLVDGSNLISSTYTMYDCVINEHEYNDDAAGV